MAIDGSQFNAVHNQRRHFTQAKLQETLKAIDANIEHDLHALDAADAAEADVQKPTADTLRERSRQLRERKGRSEGRREVMAVRGESPISLTDPDSRAMPKSPTVDVGYNVQVAVEAQQTLLVIPEVTKAVTDVDHLSGIAIPAKETLGGDHVTVVAEMGYSHGEEIKACDEAGMEP